MKTDSIENDSQKEVIDDVSEEEAESGFGPTNESDKCDSCENCDCENKNNNSDNPEEVLFKKLNEAQTAAEENKNRYLRSVADLENYKKRTLREKDDLRKYAISGLIEDLIPVIDHLILGLDAGKDTEEAKPITDGISMVLVQFLKVLDQYGVTKLDPVGEDFDPNFHDCQKHDPSDEFDEGKIISVSRSGYLLHDRLLRPASVIVSKGPESK